MANLKDIRLRIASVINTRQVTNAMKMVSAAKLRKAQDSVLKIRPYADGIEDVISTVAAQMPGGINLPLFQQRQVNHTLVILLTSNKGLCGTFNSGITKKAIDWVENQFGEKEISSQCSFFLIGRKGYDVISRLKYPIYGREDNLVHKPAFDFTAFFVQELLKRYQSGDFDRVVVFYNSFKTAASQTQCMEQLLPIQIPRQKTHKNLDYIFEPNPKAILEKYSIKLLESKMHKIILDSVASEHGARMTAMHKATDNATELISTLRLTYNKARQDNITREINEIVSGANALKR